jgi:hypothetical protein
MDVRVETGRFRYRDTGPSPFLVRERRRRDRAELSAFVIVISQEADPWLPLEDPDPPTGRMLPTSASLWWSRPGAPIPSGRSLSRYLSGLRCPGTQVIPGLIPRVRATARFPEPG